LFKILAISGSLRAASLNGMLLRAVQRLAPSDIHVDLYRGLGALPPFNQDLEAVGPPDTVVELRTRIISAQSVLIAALLGVLRALQSEGLSMAAEATE